VIVICAKARTARTDKRGQHASKRADIGRDLSDIM
jgi:hypothetical protein